MSCPFCSCPTGTVDPELIGKVAAGAVWLPISTLPKDSKGNPAPGEFVLRLKSGHLVVGHWMPGGLCVEDSPPIARGWYAWTGQLYDWTDEPTHWMPLPEAKP